MLLATAQLPDMNSAVAVCLEYIEPYLRMMHDMLAATCCH